ncbi:MAG: hypothetical protein IJ167_04810 [Lachnospiraceae bacterium]|nr:hypothetical protein [Lachnospiraceae bacterium]
MKKYIAISFVFVMLISFTGCTKTIELTDEEQYLVAEYAAELLLKYDRNIDTKYYSDDKKTAAETRTTEEITTEIVSTEEITTETTEVQVSTEELQEETTEATEVAEDDITTQAETDNVDLSGNNADKSFDIAAFAGINEVSVKYSYYMIAEEYPSMDHDGVAITIEAPNGYKLLVLKFNMENKTGDDQYIDLYSKDLEYSIIINDSKSAKQMLTILIDDLYTYQGTVEGNMFEEVVLLFQVSDGVAEEIDKGSLKLRVTDSSNNSTIINLD